jgi:hypothetical protein
VAPTLQQILKQLLHWERLGSRVLVLQADLGSAPDVERVLTTTVDRFAALSGIFHAAGQADLRYLPQLTREASAQEFAPKIQGLLHLAGAIGQLADKPAFVVLFSSLAAVLGGLAMTAYVAANRFMDAFAQADPRRHGVAWLSINWDDWAFDYTTEQVMAYAQTQARFAMTAAEGLEALERILAYGRPLQWLVATRPLSARLTQWVQQTSAAAAMAEPRHATMSELATGDTPVAALRQRIAAIYQAVLGLPAMDETANFFELGGDSLLASQILLQLRRQLPQARHIQLPAVFEYPTVREIAQYVLSTEAQRHDSGGAADCSGL